MGVWPDREVKPWKGTESWLGFCGTPSGTPSGTASAIFLPGLVVFNLVCFYVLETAVKKRQNCSKKVKKTKGWASRTSSWLVFVMISMHDKTWLVSAVVFLQMYPLLPLGGLPASKTWIKMNSGLPCQGHENLYWLIEILVNCTLVWNRILLMLCPASIITTKVAI